METVSVVNDFSVVNVFSKVTGFIYSLFSITPSPAPSPPHAKPSELKDSNKSYKQASEVTDSNKPIALNDSNVNKYSATITISQKKLTVYFPKKLNFEGVSPLFVLDVNQIIITDNNSVGHKLSLTQYFRFEINGDKNGIVLDLIINNTEHIYICVKYSITGEIQRIGFDNSYYTYTDYNSICDYFKSIVPDPNARRSRNENKYNYEAQREDYISQNQGSKEKTMKNNNALSPAGYSIHSPIDNSNKTYSNLSIDTKMYDLHRHAVEGLGTIAATRYTTSSDTVTALATTDGAPSIKDQIKPPLFDHKIKLAQATRDLVDVAHDFRTITNMSTFVNIISNRDKTFEDMLNTKLEGLLTGASNINVANSHEILKNNIRGLEKELRDEKLNFPNIPTEKYVSRDYVFAMFVIDMMNTTKEKQIRRNYSESGKQVTIETFQKYYDSLDDAEKDTFDLYVVKIMGPSNVSKALENYSKEYPSISKKIDLDGCSTGPTRNEEVESTITNVYGYLNVSINGNNTKGFIITISDNANPSNEILNLTTPNGFKITYDNVANYIMTEFKDIELPNRGKSGETNIDNKIELNENLNADLKILASFCLKTFCDKLYRTEEGVTHICTTDSYVYADPIIEYLAGNAASIPTIMRSGDERSTDESPQDGCELSSIGMSGRGFYIQPGVDSNTYIDSKYQDILKKTLGYAGFLEYLFSETNCTPINGSPQRTSQEQNPKMRNIFFENCNNESLFEKSKDTAGSLIISIPSNRLINFVERLINNMLSVVDTTNIDTTNIDTTSYETIIKGLFNLEYNKMVKNVKEYITKLKVIMALELTDKKIIKESIIQLPDLEELLTMSTPSFCVENDDALIVSKDRVLTNGDNGDANTGNDVNVEFKDVIFASNGIQITGCSDNFKEMVKSQLIKEYKLSGDTITGPITLNLLCKLKMLSKDDNVRQKINAEIDNVISNFCKIRDLECTAPTGSPPSRSTGSPSSTSTGLPSSTSTGKRKTEDRSLLSKKQRNGGSRHRKKASHKRKSRKMMYKTRKYKHH